MYLIQYGINGHTTEWTKYCKTDCAVSIGLQGLHIAVKTRPQWVAAGEEKSPETALGSEGLPRVHSVRWSDTHINE